LQEFAAPRKLLLEAKQLITHCIQGRGGMSRVLRILVTGAAGRIGRAAVGELVASGHRVRALDLVAASGTDDVVVGNLTDPDTVHRAMQGIDVLIHLAATPDDGDFFEQLLPNNLVGTYQVLEAAKLAGVHRIVLGSSGQVVWWQRFTGPLPVTAEAPPSPRGWYAATKLFQEAAGRAFAAKYGISVIAARLGWCPRDRAHIKELSQTEWGPDVYLSPGDAGRFFARAVEPKVDIRFEVIYVTSRPVRKVIYDSTPARELLGYEPRDAWPEGALDGL
jgi:NAD(P)-dependent dehydrogenase (short-subunit alcohol dehydrogenase family)